jgi:hypothetical protein
VIWPPEPICKRISHLWALAHGSSNLGESSNALAALKRLQTEHDLTDTALAFIAEYHMKEAADHLINPLELMIRLADDYQIRLSLEQMVIIVLCCLVTHVYDLFLHCPRLILRSPEPECGKTLIMVFMEEFVRDPLRTTNFTPAVIYYRTQEFPHTTFLIDETEHSKALWGKDTTFIEMFDDGHRKGACRIHRVISVKGKGKRVLEFNVWGPMMLAGVAKLSYPRQILSRSYVLDLVKDPLARDRLNADADPRFAILRGLIIEWAAGFRVRTTEISLTGRAGDNAELMIAVAESIGYGATAREALRAIYRPIDDPVTRVFFDMRQVCDGPPRLDGIWTPELLTALHKLPDSHWDEYWGASGDQDPHPLRKAELYRLMRSKGLHSETVWKYLDGKRVSGKGFTRRQLEPIWAKLFGTGTPAHINNIIRLPRHTDRHTGGTDAAE